MIFKRISSLASIFRSLLNVHCLHYYLSHTVHFYCREFILIYSGKFSHSFKFHTRAHVKISSSIECRHADDQMCTLCGIIWVKWWMQIDISNDIIQTHNTHNHSIPGRFSPFSYGCVCRKWHFSIPRSHLILYLMKNGFEINERKQMGYENQPMRKTFNWTKKLFRRVRMKDWVN